MRSLNRPVAGTWSGLRDLGSQDKELFRIDGATRRFKDGCNHFGRHPEKVLGFFDKYMK